MIVKILREEKGEEGKFANELIIFDSII